MRPIQGIFVGLVSSKTARPRASNAQLKLTSVVELEVHSWTKCLDRFTDAVTGKPLQGRDKQVLLAAILALGMNIGFKKMAQATSFSYSDLSRVARTYIREETIQRALQDVDNFALRLPMAAY